jgi:hypothetical protein
MAISECIESEEGINQGNSETAESIEEHGEEVSEKFRGNMAFTPTLTAERYHCRKQVFLIYLFYAYFDFLKISIAPPENLGGSLALSSS